MTIEERIRNAKRLARARSTPLAICEYDHGDDRRLTTCTLDHAWSDEMRAYDGRILAVVYPRGTVWS